MSKRINEQVEQLKPLLPDFLQKYYGVQNVHKNFRCIFNTHADRKPSMSYHPRDHYLKCFSCRRSGNIITVAALYWGVSNKEAISRLCKEYRIPNSYESKSGNKKNQSESLPKEGIRGLTKSTLEHFGAKYDSSFYAPYLKPDGSQGHFFMGEVIKIPSEPGSSSYIARSLNSKKFYKPANKKEPLFFSSELLNPVVFITESVFCAMTIWQNNGHAVPLNGLGWTNLIAALSDLKTSPRLILSLDNDSQGIKASNELYSELKNRGYEVINYPISGEKKDPNELFLFDVARFKAEMKKALDSFQPEQFDTKKDSLSHYIAYQLLSDLKANQDTVSTRKTGLQKIDLGLRGIREGLYIIGGRPGVGKSTFMDQLGYNLSKIAHVLYFSYEQEKIHFASKHISRLSFLKDGESLCSSDLLSGKIKSSLLDVMREYLDEESNFMFYSEKFNIDQLQRKIQEYEDKTKENPIVIIDYAQKIPVPSKKNEKDIVSHIARKMEEFAHEKEKKRTIFLISSFNRTGYYTPISINSFKETGELEYAADVVIGLQYHVMSTEKIFLNEGKTAEKDSIIAKEEQKPVRQIDFVCVKNRYGRPFSVEMEYHTEYDYFMENN